MSVSHEAQSLPPNIAAQIAAKARGDRKTVRHGGLLCSRCLTNAPATPDRYCRECRKTYGAAYKRDRTRELHELRAAVTKPAG